MPRGKKKDDNPLLWLGLLTGAAILFSKKADAPVDDYYSPWRGLSNRNPLNIKLTSINWEGKVPNNQNTDGTFEQFGDFYFGWLATLKNLETYIDNGRRTPASIIQKWDGDPTITNWNYVNYVLDRYEQLTGEPITAGTVLDDFRDLSFYSAVRTWWPFVKAMAEFENGTDAAGAIGQTRPDFNQAMNEMVS